MEHSSDGQDPLGAQVMIRTNSLTISNKEDL